MKNLFIIALLVIGTSAQAQWTQVGLDIDGESAGDRSGDGISLSSDGSIVAIGGTDNNGNGTEAGHVRVYENTAGTWTQIGTDIDGEAAGDRFGNAIGLSSDGSIVAIGAWRNDGNGANSGHVRVYENIGGTWVQIGQDIDGVGADERFGFNVSLNADGSIVAIGAPFNNENGFESGQARIYENVGGTWTQVGQDINAEEVGDRLGWRLSLNSDGTIVAIGAPGYDGNGSDAGNVRVYENLIGTWTQIGQDIDGEAAGDRSGHGISINSDGSIVAIGARFNDGNGTDSGHVRVYENIGGTWTQIGQDIDGEETQDESGVSVSLSSDGSLVAIGAWKNNGNSIVNIGHVRVYMKIWLEPGYKQVRILMEKQN